MTCGTHGSSKSASRYVPVCISPLHRYKLTQSFTFVYTLQTFRNEWVTFKYIVYSAAICLHELACTSLHEFTRVGMQGIACMYMHAQSFLQMIYELVKYKVACPRVIFPYTYVKKDSLRVVFPCIYERKHNSWYGQIHYMCMLESSLCRPT